MGEELGMMEADYTEPAMEGTPDGGANLGNDSATKKDRLPLFQTSFLGWFKSEDHSFQCTIFHQIGFEALDLPIWPAPWAVLSARKDGVSWLRPPAAPAARIAGPAHTQKPFRPVGQKGFLVQQHNRPSGYSTSTRCVTAGSPGTCTVSK